jgi:Ca2+-binding EF-hand superfamily protein
MNKALFAALACATTSAVKINATAKITTSYICEMSQTELIYSFEYLDNDGSGSISFAELQDYFGDYLDENVLR